MHENILATAARLSDDALHARLKHFAGRERDATVELVGHLAELDGRQTRLGEGPAATTKPRPPRGSKGGSRDVPAHVRRAVWKRDEGRCAFAGRSGRCTERRYLEWHHVQPFGHQGPATVENISLRCRAHNVYESELVFGPFDPSVVREAAEIYAVSRDIAPFRNGGMTRMSHGGTETPRV